MKTPGLVLAISVGLVALLVGRAVPETPYTCDVLLAIVLGAVVLNSPVRRLLGLALPSAARQPDAYAPGLRFVGRWVLRIAIVLMGLRLPAKLLGASELALIGCVAAASIPGAFFVAHGVGAWMGLPRSQVDLVAGGTMICGASAIQALAPVTGARTEEQGIAIATVFVFSVTALAVFHPIALWLNLDPSYAGLWSGLAVNDLSSAIAVGLQMGGAGDAGGVMAAAAKSARVLLLAPTLLVFAILRRDERPGRSSRAFGPRLIDHLPGFLLGYVLCAGARAVGDRAFAGSAAWELVLRADRWMVDVAMVTVSAAIGLHLELRGLLRAGVRALLTGGAASAWMAVVTLVMVTSAGRGAPWSSTVLIGLVVLGVSYAIAAVGGATAREAAASSGLAKVTDLEHAASFEREEDREVGDRHRGDRRTRRR
jgi:uncharacterized membrane protein YadS